ANAAAGAYGAIGVPVLVGAQVTGMDVLDLSRSLVLILQPLTLLIPFLLVMIIDGWRGLLETLPATLVVTIVFSGVQAGVLWFMGPELADLGAGLAAMVAIFAVSTVWKPKNVFREGGAPVPPRERNSLKEIVVAWSPFYILTLFILLWSIPAVKPPLLDWRPRRHDDQRRDSGPHGCHHDGIGQPRRDDVGVRDPRRDGHRDPARGHR